MNKTNLWLAVFVAVIGLILFMVMLGGETGVDSANIANGTIQEEDLLAINVATDGYAATYDAASGGFEWVAGGGGGGVHPVNLATDVTGDLDISDNSNLVGGVGITLNGDVIDSDLGTTVHLTSEVEGIVPIANGGTGIDTIPSNGQLLIGNFIGGYSIRNIEDCNNQNWYRLQYDGISDDPQCDSDTIGSAGITDESLLVADFLDDTPIDGQLASYDSGTGGIDWIAGVTDPGHPSGLVVEYGMGLPGRTVYAVGTETYVANRLYDAYFHVTVETIIDTIYLEIIGADVTNTAARVCVFEIDTAWQVDALVIEETFAPTTIGLKVMTLGSPYTFTPGSYVVQWGTDKNIGYRTYFGAQSAVRGAPFSESLGSSSFLLGESYHTATAEISGGCDDPGNERTGNGVTSSNAEIPIFFGVD